MSERGPEYSRVLWSELTTVTAKWKAVSEAGFTLGGYVAAAYLWYRGAAGWQVIVVVGLTTILAVLFLYAAGRSAWQKERAAKLAAEADLARIRTENAGIDLVCGQMQTSWAAHSGLPAGVLVIANIERLVNRNARAVALEIQLVSPILRFGSTTLNLSKRALLNTVEGLQVRNPQIPPLVNLTAKQGLGPAHFLFFFSYESWKTMLFVPPAQQEITLEEFAKRINDSELYLTIHDRANEVVYPEVLAPGTRDKQFARKAAEDKAAQQNGQSEAGTT